MTYFVGLDVSQRTAICVVDSGVGFLDFIVCCSLRIAKVFRSRRLLQRGSIDRQLSQALASCRKEPSWARVWLSSTAQWSLSPCQPFKRIWPCGAQWVANGRVGWKWQDHDVVWHDETRRTVPAGTVEDQQSDGAEADALANFSQMLVHGLNADGRHDKESGSRAVGITVSVSA
jgi:hypothetical protein